jgi:hypothetical protein
MPSLKKWFYLVGSLKPNESNKNHQFERYKHETQ